MRYLGTVTYLGTAYHGFERQKGFKTIQGELDRAVSIVLNKETKVHGAGRTDAGVHAKGQRFAFDSGRILDISKTINGINKALEKDIRVTNLIQVSDDFDVRRDAVAKRYSYTFHVGTSNPLELPLISQIECKSFDMDKFILCIEKFKGKHNFNAFTSKENDPFDYVRTIYDIKVEKGNNTKVVFVGDGFMRYQVRFMIGASFKVAQGSLSLEEVDALLDGGKRPKTLFAAPPNGLVLEEVYYEKIY